MKKTTRILNKSGWALIAVACFTRFVSGSTDQDYVNAPSRQHVENPSSYATFQEDIRSTDTLNCISWTTLISGGLCLFLAKKSK